MSSVSPLLVLLLLLCVGAATVRQAAAPPPVPSAYELLESHNLARGILPEGVVGYDFDQASGSFTAHLNRSCRYTVDKYKFKSRTTYTGTLSDGKLRKAHGLSIKLFLFWSSTEVTRRGDELRFVAWYFAFTFHIDSFKVSPQCG